MLSSTKNFLSLAALIPVALVACQVDVSDGGNGYTKDEARALGGVTPDGSDICALEGWYGDDECDDFCVVPDPDCPVSNCPDPNDPSVTYRGGPGEIVCSQEIDFCGPDKIMFNSPDCGCGCIDPDPGKACGGIAGITCDDGEFCSYPLAAKCGIADDMGTCQPIPQGCPENWDPVCGCDGVTYGNVCDANAHGVSVLRAGACEAETCGGIAGIACEDGEFCNMDFQCSIDDAAGYCAPLPLGCPDIWAPVCGCDGNTYGNDCDAHAAGVSVAFLGTCEDATKHCGGISGDDCPAGQFCDYEAGEGCGFDDGAGTCEPIPQGCPDVWDPVCGCDFVTYGNACEANANGVGVYANGPCNAAGG